MSGVGPLCAREGDKDTSAFVSGGHLGVRPKALLYASFTQYPSLNREGWRERRLGRDKRRVNYGLPHLLSNWQIPPPLDTQHLRGKQDASLTRGKQKMGCYLATQALPVSTKGMRLLYFA